MRISQVNGTTLMTINPELGHFALILALCLAVLQATVPILGSYLGFERWMRVGQSLALGHLVFVLISFASLATAFLNDDFSLRYVMENSNKILPNHFKFSAVWGAHEGSLLLWSLILAGWSAAVAFFCRRLPAIFLARVLSIMAMIAVGFCLFLLITSNPFERILPFSPENGSDLNPLLQDVGLIVHPPILYMGYVGFAVPFAFAIAALLGGQFDSAWARWCRPWINSAWAFLTFGIALGSWWAYYELGWGGWWFWDPVENASFLPWLVGTALMHSAAATEKRGVFRSWTLLLAIFTFSLSLLGTFLVRSGVLTSVHAFASDPERGLFILIFLGTVISGSLMLFAARGPVHAGRILFRGAAREVFLFTNNLILVTSMSMILIGTLYPLISDALDLGKVSVGPPYFNFFFVPMTLALMVFLGFSIKSRWGGTHSSYVVEFYVAPAILSLCLGLGLPILCGKVYSAQEYSYSAAFTLICVIWVTLTICRDLMSKLQSRGLAALTASYWGMCIAHFGLAVCVLGVGMSTAYETQKNMRIMVGERVTLAGYEFHLKDLSVARESNYEATRANIVVTADGREVSILRPEKRNYFSGGQVMTEAAIDASLSRDLYVALGEPLESGYWAVRFQFKPFVRCIWLGGLLIGIGGLMSLVDRRYRKKRAQALGTYTANSQRKWSRSA